MFSNNAGASVNESAAQASCLTIIALYNMLPKLPPPNYFSEVYSLKIWTIVQVNLDEKCE